MKRVLKIGGMGLILLLMFPLYAGFFVRDAQSPDDSDLAVWIPFLESNAYDDLATLNEVWVEPDEALDVEAMLAGEVGDDVLVSEWIAQNQAALEILEVAVTRQGFLDPNFMSGIPGFADALPTLSHLADLARLASLDARRAHESGGAELVQLRLNQVLTLGQMIQDSPGTLLQQFVAVKVKMIALETAWNLEVPVVDIERYADHFYGYELAHKTEYQLQVGLVDALAAEDIEWSDLSDDLPLSFFARYHFYPNLTKQALVERAQLALAQSGECDGDFSDSGLDFSGGLAYFDKNVAGEWLVYSLSPRIAVGPFCEMESLYQNVLDLN
jgi:hypothetical protein